MVSLVLWWTWRALHDSQPYDSGLAYAAGQIAWLTGHPEHLRTWNGTPLLAVTFALLSRAVSQATSADLITLANALLVVGTSLVVLSRVRAMLPRAWWILALGLVSFAPLMSTVWWKQFSIIALVLALAGYELLRRGSVPVGALVIALSVSVKPMVALLPFALLLRRETRRAGLLALVGVVAFDVAAQVVLAWRAHDLAAADPTIGLRNFFTKTSPIGDVFMCHPINFSPSSLLCRAAGGPVEWRLQRAAAYAGVALLALWAWDAVRDRSPLSWEIFAFACALSVLPSPIEWAHYEIVLAPLFMLLTVRFAQNGARLASWTGLLVAFLLASLVWDPYDSVVNSVGHLFVSSRTDIVQPVVLDDIAQFAQYVLLATAIGWYARQSPIAARGAAIGPPKASVRRT